MAFSVRSVSSAGAEADEGPGMYPQDDREAFEEAVDALQAEVSSAAVMATNDGHVRQMYQRTIKALTEQLRKDAETHRITWAEAARQANAARNDTLEVMRSQTSPIGRSIAESLKKEGKTLNELIARYTIKLFGEGAEFEALSAAQKDQVYTEIVLAAGRANPRVTAMATMTSRVGRGLLILSIAISVYKVGTSDDPWDTAEHEAAITGGGILGGAAGGALAGLACGPGAPVCVTIGAFVGGAIGAFGIDLVW
jgi:hypothetical protein